MKKMKASASMSCCDKPPYPDFRGKALLNLGIATLLVLYGFSYVDFLTVAKVVGLLFALKGMIQLAHCR